MTGDNFRNKLFFCVSTSSHPPVHWAALHVINNKQLLDEVEHDNENYQGREYPPKPKPEADNTNRGLDNFAIMRKPNPMIV